MSSHTNTKDRSTFNSMINNLTGKTSASPKFQAPWLSFELDSQAWKPPYTACQTEMLLNDNFVNSM